MLARLAIYAFGMHSRVNTALARMVNLAERPVDFEDRRITLIFGHESRLRRLSTIG
jgi:hypothetical protein